MQMLFNETEHPNTRGAQQEHDHFGARIHRQFFRRYRNVHRTGARCRQRIFLVDHAQGKLFLA